MLVERGLRIESRAVIFDLDFHPFAAHPDLEAGARSMSMTRHVSQRLLHHAIRGGLNLDVETYSLRAAVFEVHFDVCLFLITIDVSQQRGDESEIVKHGRGALAVRPSRPR